MGTRVSVDGRQRSFRPTKLQGMNAPHEPSDAVNLSNNATDEGVFETVRDAYDAVYDALASSPSFNRIWRTNAYGGTFPRSSPTSAS